MTASTERDLPLADLVQSDPHGVLRHAESKLLESHLSRRDEAEIRWAKGLALRELDDLSAARSELIIAAELAGQDQAPKMVGRIGVSRAMVEMSLGEPGVARRLLDDVEPLLEGADLGRLVHQRGLLDHRAGNLDAAIAHYRRALLLMRNGNDRIGEMRACLNLGLLLGQRGDPSAGLVVLVDAHELALELDQYLLAAMAAQNIGYLHSLLGRIPEALSWYTTAESGYASVGDDLHVALVGADRAATLLQAGLGAEALAEATRVHRVISESDNVLDLAETDLVAARAALVAGDRAGATAGASRAEQSFVDNRREAWIPLTHLILVLAGADEAEFSEFIERADFVATELDHYGWSAESIHLRVAAARRALAEDRPHVAHRLVETVGTPRSGLPVADGIAAWTAQAIRLLTLHDRAGTRRAVTLGLRVLESNALVVQAVDLRAHAVDHGKYLAEIGARLAIEDGRARELLERVEALRNVTSRNRGGPSSIGEALSDDLAALRVLEVERREAVADGRGLVEIDRRRVQLESAVRSHRREATGGRVETGTVRAAVRALGARQVVAFEIVDDRIWSVSIVGGRAALHALDASGVAGGIDAVMFALHRLARSNATDRSAAWALSSLRDAAGSLDSLLVPERVRRSGAPVVVVPAGPLNGLPWRVMSSMTSRACTVSNSLTGWLLGRRSTRSDGTVLFVAGPDLSHADDEVETLAGRGRFHRVLFSQQATVSSVQDELASSSIAHFACHGVFRADNPMFSSLRLADGNLTVYDLEQCEQLPHTIVMSACNAGQNAVLRGGALLGMASALIQLGVSSVIAPLTPVNDERSVDLMVRLHTHLAAGLEPAEALAKASIGPDGELDPTAAPFICFGS